MEGRLRRTFSTIAVLMMVATGILIEPVIGQTNCPRRENYQPCNCSASPYGGYVVECYKIPIQDVVNVFKRTTTTRIDIFNFTLSAVDASTDSIITIPRDLLNNHDVYYDIWLFSPNNRSYSLRIDPEAFRSSRSSTSWFYLYNWDASRLDFGFLKDFTYLFQLEISSASNVQMANWSSIPPLRNFLSLKILSSTGLNDWETFPSLVRGLQVLDLSDNQIQNSRMDRILTWTRTHSSRTLRTLYIDKNDLTRIPSQIPSFISLRALDIGRQKTGIQSIASNAIKFSGAVDLLLLSTNKIASIEPGAFEGNFTGAFVDLSFNDLTRFEELVFKAMLQQMFTNDSYLFALRNPFDCTNDPCHLAWLVRDNRQLLPPLYAYCSNGTSFRQLNPSAFSQCGITTPAPTVTTPTSPATTPTTPATTPTTPATTPTTPETTPTSAVTTPTSPATTPTSVVTTQTSSVTTSLSTVTPTPSATTSGSTLTIAFSEVTTKTAKPSSSSSVRLTSHNQIQIIITLICVLVSAEKKFQ